MLERIFNFLQHLVQSFLSVLKVIIQSKLNTPFQPSKQEQEVIILGTGPSFKDSYEQHIDQLQSKDKIGLNHFANKPEYVILKPNLYVIGAPELWNDNLEDEYLERAKKLYESIDKKTTWDMTLLLGVKAKKSRLIQQLNNHKHIRIEYYNRTPIEGLTQITHFLFTLKLGMPRPHNVMIPSIMISIWKGYKKIILIGADHSWHENMKVDTHNNVMLDQKHYYDKKENWKTMHQKGKRPRLIHEVFDKFRLAFLGYHIINKYISKKNISVVNASSKSYIDAFPRINL